MMHAVDLLALLRIDDGYSCDDGAVLLFSSGWLAVMSDGSTPPLSGSYFILHMHHLDLGLHT